jgi:YoeB-like toxin of bacterial type II toxin-antitoxin system
MRELIFKNESFDDLQDWLRNDRKSAERLVRILQECRRTPFEGIGKPEPLIGHDVSTKKTVLSTKLPKKRFLYIHSRVITKNNARRPLQTSYLQPISRITSKHLPKNLPPKKQPHKQQTVIRCSLRGSFIRCSVYFSFKPSSINSLTFVIESASA